MGGTDHRAYEPLTALLEESFAAAGRRHHHVLPTPGGNTFDQAGVTAYRESHVRTRSAAASVGGSRLRAFQRRGYPNLTLPHIAAEPGEG